MRTVAIIADTHANFHALKAVIDQIDADREIEGIWFLGDMLGRGVEPMETVTLLRERYDEQCHDRFLRKGWLAGNHDRFIVDRLNGTEFHNIAVDRQHRVKLAENGDNWRWLRDLPLHSSPARGIHLAHGTIAFEDDGRWDEACAVGASCTGGFHVARQFEALRQHSRLSLPRIVINAHTHIPGLWRYDNRREITDEAFCAALEYERPTASVWQLKPFHMRSYQFHNLTSKPICFNPGSVSFARGEPRCATYVKLKIDLAADLAEVEFRAAAYNYDGAHNFPTDYDEDLKKELRAHLTVDDTFFQNRPTGSLLCH
jgi:predicted phosphodiesterase